MRFRLKWIWKAAVAAAMGALAFTYGKQTLQVVKAKLDAHAARGVVLERQLEELQKKAAAAKDEEQKKLHMQKAETLQTKRDDLLRRREELIGNTSGDLKVSDVQLAVARNSRHPSRA